MTARFELERRRHLRNLFTQKRMVEVWRKLVRAQMRKFDITDLHDYYDFNFSIESRADLLTERILSGQYRAEQPLIYRSEKKFGVCRHMMIPAPSDALVFQVLTDALYETIIKAQPSEGAFYSRERHALNLPHEHENATSYPWFILWPKFQKEIWKFSRAHRYLVTTDLTNYFDNIGLRELRHVISAIAKTKEVYLDLLFSLIEDLSWKPDYLPTSHKGLPTINIEAPRLLAHALLFEVDHVLKKRTSDNFVRWMDDINFGTDDRRAANQILGEINDVLKSRGLALNLGKTEVMTSKEAEFHFMVQENLEMDRYQRRAKRLKNKILRKRLAKLLHARLDTHLQSSKAKNKDKITKRYFSVLGTLRIAVALRPARDLYVSQPGIRNSILQYLSKLPFSKRVAATFISLVSRTEQYDDATRFGLVKALIDWNVPRDRDGKRFVRTIIRKIKTTHTAFNWLCYLVFLCKYGETYEVVDAVNFGRQFKESFFSRQRMAALPRALQVNPAIVRRAWRAEISTGYSDSASVANNLLGFSRANFPLARRDQRLHSYLFPTERHAVYPLPKFLLLCCLAYSESNDGKTVQRPEVVDHVTDPWYQHWLRTIAPQWF